MRPIGPFWTAALCAALVLSALVLVACAGEPSGGLPPAEGDAPNGAAPPAGEGAWFEDAGDVAGLDFVHVNGMRGEQDFVEMMGAGVALFDFDADGDLDAYFAQGHPLGEAAAVSGAPSAEGGRLFRNDLAAAGGLPRFVDTTEASGLRAWGYGMGVAVGDYDNDGLPDLYLANWGSDQLWHNEGDGRFAEVTAAAGVAVDGWSSSASFFDYDRDGWLDLFVARYVDFDLDSDLQCTSPATGEVDYCGPQSFSPTPDRLLHNRGDGSFEDVSQPMGIASATGPGLGVVAVDVDADGWTDVYVANDGGENHLWMNRQGARFENAGPISGSAVDQAGKAQASMGVAAEDFDGDGAIDLFITHLADETHTFYAGDGRGIFRDRTVASGLGMASLSFTGFGVGALDADNDGWLDLLVADGEVVTIYAQKSAGERLPLRQTNQFLYNRQGRFEDWTERAGAALVKADVHRGLAYGDVDNDGDADALLTRNNGPALLLLNRVGQQRHWLGLQLVDGATGRDLLGAEARLELADGTLLLRRAQSDGSYSSARDPRILFGLGEGGQPVEIEVRWPTGQRERWPGLERDRYHRLVQGEGEATE